MTQANLLELALTPSLSEASEQIIGFISGAWLSNKSLRKRPVTQQQGRHFSLQILTPNLHLAALEKGNSRSRAGARLRIFPTIRC